MAMAKDSEGKRDTRLCGSLTAKGKLAVEVKLSMSHPLFVTWFTVSTLITTHGCASHLLLEVVRQHNT